MLNWSAARRYTPNSTLAYEYPAGESLALFGNEGTPSLYQGNYPAVGSLPYQRREKEECMLMPSGTSSSLMLPVAGKTSQHPGRPTIRPVTCYTCNSHHWVHAG